MFTVLVCDLSRDWTLLHLHRNNNLLYRVRVRPRVVFLKKMTQRSGSTTQEYDERTHWTIVLLAHELFLLPLPPKSAVNFFCYSNVQPALRLSCKCCISSLMVVFTQGQPCKIQFHMMCPKIYRCIIIRNWNLTLFWSVFVLWQTAGQTKWLLINPALTNIFCNSRVHPLSRSVGPMYKKFNWWQNTVGYRMEQHMVQILDGIFLGDIQVGFNIGAF